MAEFEKVPSKQRNKITERRNGKYVTFRCPKSDCTYETPYVLSRNSAQQYIDLHNKDFHGKK